MFLEQHEQTMENSTHGKNDPKDDLNLEGDFYPINLF
jgi:hypothetical protein